MPHPVYRAPGLVAVQGRAILATAENLSALCIAQAASRAAPVIFSVCSGPIDMRVGSFASGSPESSLLNAAAVVMARHYGLPCLVAGFVCDADSPGAPAGGREAPDGPGAEVRGGGP